MRDEDRLALLLRLSDAAAQKPAASNPTDAPNDKQII
jgi:hypothetical protein